MIGQGRVIRCASSGFIAAELKRAPGHGCAMHVRTRPNSNSRGARCPVWPRIVIHWHTSTGRCSFSSQTRRRRSAPLGTTAQWTFQTRTVPSRLTVASELASELKLIALMYSSGER